MINNYMVICVCKDTKKNHVKIKWKTKCERGCPKSLIHEGQFANHPYNRI